MFAQGIAELVLIVEDVLGGADFYRDVVGLAPIGEPSDEWAWFWTGPPDASTRLALRRGKLLFEDHSPFPPPDRFGRVHFAFEVERSRVEAAVAHVRAHGTTVYGPARLEWMKADAYYFYDPVGNLLEWWSPDPV